jgi:hypothetical protein
MWAIWVHMDSGTSLDAKQASLPSRGSDTSFRHSFSEYMSALRLLTMYWACHSQSYW